MPDDYWDAGVHVFADRVIVNPWPRRLGLRRASVAPFVRLDPDAAPAAIAEAVVRCLQLSAGRDPASPCMRVDSQGFLRAAGARSWRAYDPVALVDVRHEPDNDVTVISPWRRDGPGHGPATTRPWRVPGGPRAADLADPIARALAKSASFHVPKRVAKRAAKRRKSAKPGSRRPRVEA